MKTKIITLSLFAVASVGVLASALLYSNSKGGLASVGNSSARVYVTKGVKLKGDKGYYQVTLEIDQKKGITTIGEKVNSSSKKVGLEE